MTSYPNCVALCGEAEHGKDTVGAKLVDLGYVRMSFAQPVYDMAYAINPIILPEPYITRLQTLINRHGWEYSKRMFPEVRTILQRVGTEAGRGVLSDNIWIDILLKKVDIALANSQQIVVTDVRFENEATALKKRGFEVWRVYRPNYRAQIDRSHESESGVKRVPVDLIVVNGGTKDDLEAVIMNVLNGKDMFIRCTTCHPSFMDTPVFGCPHSTEAINRRN